MGTQSYLAAALLAKHADPLAVSLGLHNFLGPKNLTVRPKEPVDHEPDDLARSELVSSRLVLRFIETPERRRDADQCRQTSREPRRAGSIHPAWKSPSRTRSTLKT